MKTAGFKKELEVWILHELMQKNLLDHIFISRCDKIALFAQQLIRRYEKCITYDNSGAKKIKDTRMEHFNESTVYLGSSII